MNSLSRSVMRTIIFPPVVTELLQNRLLQLPTRPYDYQSFERVIQESQEVVHRTIPEELKQKIRHVASSDIGFAEIVGVPQEPTLMPTPGRDNEIERLKQTFVKERFAIGISHLLGLEIFNFAQEGWGQGKLIFNVFPVKEMINLKGAGGTNANFGFHTENAWHPIPIKVLFLVGMRQDHEKRAETYAVSVADVIQELSQEELDILSREHFVIDPPEIHRKMEQERGIPFAASASFVGPILSEQDGFKQLKVNFNGMRALNNPRAQEVLHKVERIAKKIAETFFLRADNMVIVNNERAIHTRNGFTARFDGADRWFQRYYLTDSCSLWKKSAVCAEDFEGLLSKVMSEQLIQMLQARGFLDQDRRITCQFMPYERHFLLPLPEPLMGLELELRKRLILKGPSFPNRVV